MSVEDWMNQHPEQYDEILNHLSRIIFLREWRQLHPEANAFQRKVVMKAADGVIKIVLETK
jgi:membrane-bound lytic murein transglycosylase